MPKASSQFPQPAPAVSPRRQGAAPGTQAPGPVAAHRHPHLKMSSMMSAMGAKCQPGYITASRASRQVVATRSVTMSSTAGSRGSGWGGCQGRGGQAAEVVCRLGGRRRRCCCSVAAQCSVWLQRSLLLHAPSSGAPLSLPFSSPPPPQPDPRTRAQHGALVELAGKAAVQLVTHKGGKVGQHGGTRAVQRHGKGV